MNFWTKKSDFDQCDRIFCENLQKCLFLYFLGMSYDWISKTLYFVDGASKTIELVRVDVKNEGHMRKTILDQQTLRKPRGLAVHPLHGYLFYSDWNEENPHIGNVQFYFNDNFGH